MRTIFFILQKEFRQIFRHRTMLPILFFMPFLQLVILSNAADYEIKNISLLVVDLDHSSFSRKLIGKFQASDHFNVVGISASQKTAYRALEKDDADLFLQFPRHFERDLLKENEASLQLTINAINGSKAGLAYAYANAIIRDFNSDILVKAFPANSQIHTVTPVSGIDIIYSHWFNPDLNYFTFMVPGILVLLITMIGMFLSGMNIVKEKEIGTIEQINVTPIKKHHFIIGKLLPFWIIALVELAIGLVLGKLVFHIPIVGNLGLIFGFAGIYMALILGIGLFISTFTDTQQQAMFISWFFLVIFILMSGLFTPIEGMPPWAQSLTRFNPIAYFVEVIRMVMLKGSGWPDIQWHFWKISAMAVGINLLAILNYRKRTA